MKGELQCYPTPYQKPVRSDGRRRRRALQRRARGGLGECLRPQHRRKEAARSHLKIKITPNERRDSCDFRVSVVPKLARRLTSRRRSCSPSALMAPSLRRSARIRCRASSTSRATKRRCPQTVNFGKLREVNVTKGEITSWLPIPPPTFKNAGFFGGATELAQYLVETGAAHERSNMEIESKQKIMEIDGQKYCWDSRNLCWVPIKPVKFIPDR